MLAPRSHNTLSNEEPPILQGIVKLPGFLTFWGDFFWIMTLYSFMSMIILRSSKHLFLDNNSI